MKIEVSIGEVIDKITILEIKKDKIKDFNKLKYIEKELSILKNSLMEENIHVPYEMIAELKDINCKLWDLEDLIRQKEKQNIFDEYFIDLARKDAIFNDERFLAKNKINNYCDSSIKEQKSYEGLYKPN